MIEGMIIAGYALGSNTGYIYTRGEYKYLIDIMDVAIAEAREAGILGKNVLGSDFLVRYPHAYGCGCLYLRRRDGTACRLSRAFAAIRG